MYLSLLDVALWVPLIVVGELPLRMIPPILPPYPILISPVDSILEASGKQVKFQI